MRCDLYSYSGNTFNAKAIALEHKPGKPFLKVHFHKPPNNAFMGSILRVSCLAAIGSTTPSLQLMLMDSTYKQLFWKVSWDGERDYTPPGHNKADSVKMMTRNGPTILSRFAFQVYKELDGSSFQCFTVDKKSENSYIEEEIAESPTSKQLN
ncbi:hypothetical protein EGW08_021209, partial [Elysia chlorotica]